MIAGQRLVASDGYEVALFPMPYLYMSQDEGGDYSHQGTYNIDLLGWGANGRVYQAPIYAPCTMKVMQFYSGYNNGNTVAFQSVNKVHLPNGQLDYLTIEFAHDASPPVTVVGTIVNQGDLCYHTGTYGNVTGDHVHTCVGQGTWQGSVPRPPNNNYDLANRIHYWDGVYVNDTVVVNGFGHDWQIWSGPTPPPVSVKPTSKRFPWVLYARKLRQKR